MDLVNYIRTLTPICPIKAEAGCGCESFAMACSPLMASGAPQGSSVEFMHIMQRRENPSFTHGALFSGIDPLAPMPTMQTDTKQQVR